MDSGRIALFALPAMAVTPGVIVPLQPIAAQASRATAQPITPARIAEINAFVRRHGIGREMGGNTNAQLGLTQAGVRYRACQLGFMLPDSADRRHLWSIHEAPRDVVHVFWIEGQDVDAWVFDLRGNLITAGRRREGRFEVIAVAQVRATFEAEMRLWSQLALASPDVPADQRCNSAARN